MPEECLFCSIIEGSVPAKKVAETGLTMAFLDINPRNPGHTLLLPKKHYTHLLEMPDKELTGFFSDLKKVSTAVQAATKADGLSISHSIGQAAGQMVGHMHFHIIPRFATEAPPGLESVLSVKKMGEDALDKVAALISAEMSGERKMDFSPKPKDEEEEDDAFNF